MSAYAYQKASSSVLAKAIRYALSRWDALTLILRNGRACIDNLAAERAMRPIALGRKAWLFAGSDRGGERAAAVYTLIANDKRNDVDQRAWLANVGSVRARGGISLIAMV